jgi:hypothetical protein
MQPGGQSGRSVKKMLTGLARRAGLPGNAQACSGGLLWGARSGGLSLDRAVTGADPPFKPAMLASAEVERGSDPIRQAIAFNRELSRETFREAALLCITFFWAERMRTGWAAVNAAVAAALSPEAIASSTLRT